MPYHDMREFLARLEQVGQLKKVKASVDKDWEISTVMRKCIFDNPKESRPALLFEKIKGYSSTVAVGALLTRTKYAIALETDEKDLVTPWLNALRNPMPPKLVSSGPCKENVLKGRDARLSLFPIPTWTPGKDGGPYISAGCVVTKDPDTGARNVGTYRFMVRSDYECGVLITPAQHIGIHYTKHERRGAPMEVAVAIGPDPSVCLAAVAGVPYGVDEYGVAGGLRGQPLELVKCETVDLEVPAAAEIVIEGEIPPHERVEEGPFGEFTGFMGPKGQRPAFKVKAITYRNNPIYHGYISQMPPSESSNIRGIAMEAAAHQCMVDNGVPGVKNIHVTEAGGAWFHYIVAIEASYPGHARQVIQVLQGAKPNYCKFVTVVDSDVDIFDPFQVEWAVTTRVQPDRDIFVVSDCPGFPLDPSQHPDRRFYSSKMGIDATKGFDFEYPEISLPDKSYFEKAEKRWPEYGI